MRLLLILLLTFVCMQPTLAVQVNGYCYLEGETNHSGTKVELIKVNSSEIVDVTYTETSGYFCFDIAAGRYNLEYSHACFEMFNALNLKLEEDSTLVPVAIAVSCLPLSGSLSGFLESGDYRIVKNIRVRKGDSLSIAPGTSFHFDGSYSFKITGTLLAEGTEEDSIVFTCNIHSNHSRWNGLRFSRKGASGSRLAYCLIANADSRTGGLICRLSSPTISHCTFQGNTAKWGGGVLCSCGSPRFINCRIINNRARHGGGGVYCRGSSSVFTDCIITDNSADWYGGSVYCRRSTSAFTNCTITNNHAGWYGGGVYGSNSSLFFKECILSDNSADHQGDNVFRDNSSMIFTNCVLEQ